MAPKKDKGKKEDEKGGAFNEVERTFLELQLADSNRKVARLRTAVDEYEVRLEELQKAYDKLDEDRADIISYLKKMLTVKNEENNELKEKGREYTDKRRRARDVELQVGDKVYVKNANKTNKLSLNFDTATHTVKSKNGGDVEVQNDETGQQLRRNILHLKKVEEEWKSVNKEIDGQNLEMAVEESSEKEIEDNRDFENQNSE